MASQVIFEIISDESTEQDHLQLACLKAAECFRSKKRVFIYTDSQKSAHQVDELLWAFDANSFIPHNLPGEGLRGGSPVEISWQEPSGQRQVLINLSSEVPRFAGQFSQIFDFVPLDETLKQQARLRYRAYQQLGFNVSTKQSTQAA